MIVINKKKKYKVLTIKGLMTLDLSFRQITDISEIKGIKNLSALQVLNLHNNSIAKITGLENLSGLQELYLHSNSIEEITGLENLINLQVLNLHSNSIEEITGLDILSALQVLYLCNISIEVITGLENLSDLQKLSLRNNSISEITGLENLTNLQELYLNSNSIEEIKGFSGLNKLTRLGLYENPVHKWVKKRFKTSYASTIKNIPELVKYCWKNEKAKDEAIQYIKDLPLIYEEISFGDIQSKTEIEITELRKIVEKLILKRQLEAKIRGNTIYFAKTPISKGTIEKSKESSFKPLREGIKKTTFKESRVSGEFSPNDIEVLRGGDWKVEGSQSVFYYKVKVKNNSQFVITNIQIILTSVPRGLRAHLDKYTISNLKPGSFESPTFKLNAQESCVGDMIEGIITYTDPIGKQQTIQISPYEICYVCNLLTPKPISKREFDRKVDFMEEKKLVVDSHLNLTDLESKIEQIVKNCNFALLQDMKGSQDEGFVKIEAFAEGLYDKQDVALSVAIQKAEEGSKLVVKAMSDRSEKVTDLLRDFSIKLDDIKSDTELIKEYTSQIELIFDNVDDLEAYLKDHLASDWEKIKADYTAYKEGIITRKQLIGRGVKTIGKRFVKKIIEKVSPI